MRKLLLVLLLWATPLYAQLPVVPNAFGFGMDTRAAYGLAPGTQPTVLRVQNINDSGANSLRAALEASGPRVVIFETSGTIVLATDILVTNPYLTVAGQTAPSPGITLKGFGIQIFSHDILIQHLRIRPGDGPPLLPQTEDHDANIIYEASAYNVVLDHNSLSWAQDKLSIYYGGPSGGDVTYWRNIFSESLYRAANIIPQGGSWAAGPPSSLNLSLGRGDSAVQTNAAVIQNLFAHNSDRNPEIQGPINVIFANNIIYDWGKDQNTYPWATFLYNAASDLPPQVNAIGNTYIAGIDTGGFSPLIAVGTWNVHAGTQLYLSDNAVDQTRQSITPFAASSGFDPRVETPPVSMSGITVMPSGTAKDFVLANSGARPVDRDTVDSRIIIETIARTGGRITSQSEVGGWPTLAENARALTLPADPNTVTGSGYTNLEVWLHGYSCSVEGGAGCVPPPVPTIVPRLSVMGVGR